MKKNDKRLFALSIAAAMLFVMPTGASAMHIMEGYLPMGHAIAWGALCLPFLAMGFISINGRGLCICFIRIKDSKCYRLQFPSDRNRTGRYSFWTCCNEHHRYHRFAVSGTSACTRRIDYPRCQHLLYGNCRSIFKLRSLSSVPQMRSK